MKSTYNILFVGLTCLFSASAQTNSTSPLQPTDTSSATAAANPGTNLVAPPAMAVTAPDATTNVTVAVTEAVVEAGTNPPVASPAVAIPHIKMNDVKITVAIESLTRLANINYMLDPKIGYDLPDANGQIKVEPTLSINWENITAENALLALLDNYGLQLTTDKRTGIDRITMKDPTAPPPLFTRVIQLKYASVSNMLDSAQSVLTDKRSRVLTDPRTSQLVVVGTDPEQQAVATLVDQLDKPTRQVLIETRLIQISTNPRTQKGVDWSGTLQQQHVTFGNGNSIGSFTTTFPGTGGTSGAGVATPGSSSSTVGQVINAVGGGGFAWNTKSGTTPDVGFLNADGLSAVLSFLNTSANAQIMSTPRIVTLDNEMATISVTRGYPIFQVSAGSANNAGGSSVSYSNVGTILMVTPRISANDYIWLRVTPEVSSFFGNFSQSVGSGSSATVLTAPVFDNRTLTTQVMIPNSNTLVMGGLVTDNPSGTYSKVPLLGDIPGLGFMFRSEDKQFNKDNLLIFITPTIVKDSDFQASKAGDFLKSKPDLLKQSMDPNTAWDSAQPKGDWSDPITQTTK
jgi:type II secretory pathway component GspD/PulD (secretin)